MNSLKVVFLRLCFLVLAYSHLNDPAFATPIPDSFGLAIYCINEVYDRVRKAAEIGEDWVLLISPDVMHKACVCVLERKIILSYKFTQGLHCKDEVACVLGHELAHIKLGHTVNMRFGDDVEAEADYHGYIYAKRAGFHPNVCGLLERNQFPPKRIAHLKALIVAGR